MKDPGKELPPGGTKFSLRQFSSRSILLLIFITITLALTGSGYSLPAPFFPIVAKRKGLSMTKTGIVFAVFELSMMICMILFGIYMTRIGTSFVLKSGIFVSGCSTMLFGVVYLCPGDFSFFTICIAGRVVAAIGFSAIFVACFTVLSSQFPNYVAILMGIQEAAFCVGMMIGPAVGGALYEVGGFGLPFYTIGAAVLVNGGIVLLILPDVKVSPKPLQNLLFQFMKRPLVLIGVMNMVVVAFTNTVLQPTLAVHLTKLSMTPLLVGLIFTIRPFGLTLASLVMGYLVDVKGLCFPMILLGGLFAIVGMVLIGPSPFLQLPLEGWTVVLAMTFQGVGGSVVPSTRALIDGASQEYAGDRTELFAVAGSLVQAAYGLGALLGPFIGGVTVQYLGFSNAATLYPGIVACSMLVTTLYVVFRKEPSSKPTKTMGETTSLKTSMSNKELEMTPIKGDF